MKEHMNRIIEYANSMGCDATNIRDAAHEMCHALETGTDDWSRNGVHEGLVDKWERGDLVAAEIRARAVERMVCEDFSVEYDIDHWMMIAWMETTKMFPGLPTKFFHTTVYSAMNTTECKEMTERIIKIGQDQ